MMDQTKPSMKTVTISNVLDEVTAIWENENKTPIILNASGLMDRFYRHRDVNIIDAKALFLKERMQNISKDRLLEGMRVQLVNAMKYGKTLVISMQTSAADISGRYNQSDAFPVPEVFIPDQIVQERVWSKFVKEEDKVYPNTNVKLFVVKPEFNVVITSQFSEEDHEEFLQDALPMQYCKPLLLKD